MPDIDQANSWYQRRIERTVATEPFTSSGEPGRDLMRVAIDGFSYWHIQTAIDDGLMPNLQQMRDEGWPRTENDLVESDSS